MSKSTEAILSKFQPVFYPRSIAVVGSYGQERGVGAFYYGSLNDAGFKGELYPVSRSGGEFSGRKIYPDLLSIPGPVDHVYVCVPRHQLPELLDQCAAKQVKVVSFFTAGFSELDSEGKALEVTLLEKARKGKFNLIGPNCIGAYSPEMNVIFSLPIFKGPAGDIAFLCQSGSLYIKILQLGRVRGVTYSKGVSYGNGIDLDSVDFLEYYGADPKTKAIVVYIEGVRQGKRFLRVAREVAREKPVIMVRGGRGDAGKRAISSHTGSLSSSESVWSALEHQTGIVMVDSMEEMADTALAIQKLGQFNGGVVTLTGLANGGGGEAVLAADSFSLAGLDMPAFRKETRLEMGKLLNSVGSILENPLDVSQSYRNPVLIAQVAETALKDPQMGALVVLLYFDLNYSMDGVEKVRDLNDGILKLRESTGKNIVMVMPPAIFEEGRMEEEKRLNRLGVAVYPSLERAAKALCNLKKISENRHRKS